MPLLHYLNYFSLFTSTPQIMSELPKELEPQFRRWKQFLKLSATEDANGVEAANKLVTKCARDPALVWLCFYSLLIVVTQTLQVLLSSFAAVFVTQINFNFTDRCSLTFICC